MSARNLLLGLSLALLAACHEMGQEITINLDGSIKVDLITVQSPSYAGCQLPDLEKRAERWTAAFEATEVKGRFTGRTTELTEEERCLTRDSLLFSTAADYNSYVDAWLADKGKDGKLELPGEIFVGRIALTGPVNMDGTPIDAEDYRTGSLRVVPTVAKTAVEMGLTTPWLDSMPVWITVNAPADPTWVEGDPSVNERSLAWTHSIADWVEASPYVVWWTP